MGKALLAMIATLVTGILFMAVGNDFLNGFSELGVVVAVAVMGAFIIYFNDKKK